MRMDGYTDTERGILQSAATKQPSWEPAISKLEKLLDNGDIFNSEENMACLMQVYNDLTLIQAYKDLLWQLTDAVKAQVTTAMMAKNIFREVKS